MLDLFAGLRGWSDPFVARGHEAFSIDWSLEFEVDAHLDINDTEAVVAALPWRPDIILASPPCEKFSVMNIGRNWTTDGTPRNDGAVQALALIESTRRLIATLAPAAFVIENPRAKLRALPVLADLDRRTVTYCHYGEARMKPTDLWVAGLPSLRLEPPCRNGDPCHTSAPRGSRTGTQGMPSALAAKIPEALATAVCIAAERDILRAQGAEFERPIAPIITATGGAQLGLFHD